LDTERFLAFTEIKRHPVRAGSASLQGYLEVDMDPKIVAVTVVSVIAILVVVWVVVRNQRTAKLRRHFGAEYERTVRENGPRRAETVLLEREKRVEGLSIRELDAEEREKFVSQWRTVQTRFVDDPRGAVGDADLLVDCLMQTRGYPVTDFEQRAADISVGHPRVVENYRAARQIALRHRQGQATTEDLRHAIIYYRSLFDELLQTGPAGRIREVA
jgi:hypothetical protein